MLGYIARRILAAIPVMAVVALLVFSLLSLAPGDPAAVIAGDHATVAEIEEVRAALGLDQPFLIRFGHWFLRILQGDLGASIYSNRPVSSLILDRMPPTFFLMVLTVIISVSVAVPLGVLAAWRQGAVVDRLVMVLAVLGFSVPVFVVGYLLAYAFALRLDWLPVQGYAPLSEGFLSFIGHLILPATALSAVYVALVARISRAAMIEVLGQDYIRTARAKGLGERAVLIVHALKSAAVPIVTVIGLGVGGMISGAVATETVFAIPGLGRLTVDAILQRDYPVIQGLVLFFSFAYVLVNLLVDLIYTLVDPRIRY